MEWNYGISQKMWQWQMSVMEMIRNQNHEKKKSMDHETHTQIRLESKDLLEVNPRKQQGERS